MGSAGVRWDAWEAVSEALGERCARLRLSSHPPCSAHCRRPLTPSPFPPPHPLFGQRGPKGEVGTVKH